MSRVRNRPIDPSSTSPPPPRDCHIHRGCRLLRWRRASGTALRDAYGGPLQRGEAVADEGEHRLEEPKLHQLVGVQVPRTGPPPPPVPHSGPLHPPGERPLAALREVLQDDNALQADGIAIVTGGADPLDSWSPPFYCEVPCGRKGWSPNIYVTF